MAYLVGGVVAMIISGFNIYSIVFLLYFTFFGIYPIIRNFFIKLKLKKYLIIIIGSIWCVAVSFGAYFYYGLIGVDLFYGLPEWFIEYSLYILVFCAILFYIIFDRFIIVVQRVLNYYLYKIIK
jgi:hypothetical protein